MHKPQSQNVCCILKKLILSSSIKRVVFLMLEIISDTFFSKRKEGIKNKTKKQPESNHQEELQKKKGYFNLCIQ